VLVTFDKYFLNIKGECDTRRVLPQDGVGYNSKEGLAWPLGFTRVCCQSGR